MAFGSVRSFQVYSVIAAIFITSLVIYFSLQYSDSFLVYTLDDPYIHLAVAESILEGGYGINSGEFASPSSSIVYPYLLTLPVVFGVGDYGPLIYALPASLVSVWILGGHIWSRVQPLFGFYTTFAFLLLGPLVVFAINAAALPMTGMEGNPPRK